MKYRSPLLLGNWGGCCWVPFQDGFVTILEYVWGDANGNLMVNIADASHIINYIFFEGPISDPPESGDANGDTSVNMADAGYIIDYIFHDGPAPISP